MAAGSAIAFGSHWRAAASGSPLQTAPGPYGPLDGRTPDDLGLLLPEGFSARLAATSGQAVAGTDYTWHAFPDGGACFADAEGDGWAYASNSEVPGGGGGVGVLRFDGDAQVVDAYRILVDTSTNCAGGATPWGTWLSCEEVGDGQVWECDPTQAGQGQVRPALGRFEHEAVAVDPEGEQLYLTEDDADGRFYRFSPSGYPSLDEGRLEVAEVAADGAVRWTLVPDPSAAEQPTRQQAGGTPFNGGEGVWFDSGVVYFSTKGDDTVRSYDTATERMEVVYAAADDPDRTLTGVDNLTVSASGDLFVCEDGGNMELVVITPERTVTPFLRVLGQDGSELAGVAFSPDGGRLLLSSQRGGGGAGLTYLVEGPFRQPAAPQVDPPTTALRAPAAGGDSSGSDVPWPAIGVGAAVVAGAAAGAVVLRRRRASTPGTPAGGDVDPAG